MATSQLDRLPLAVAQIAGGRAAIGAERAVGRDAVGREEGV
jgi:hypothetical protein